MSPFALGLKGIKLSGAEMESAAGGDYSGPCNHRNAYKTQGIKHWIVEGYIYWKECECQAVFLLIR